MIIYFIYLFINSSRGLDHSQSKLHYEVQKRKKKKKTKIRNTNANKNNNTLETKKKNGNENRIGEDIDKKINNLYDRASCSVAYQYGI